jgi:hypothetical protein
VRSDTALGGLENGLAKLWSEKKINKKAHAGRGQESKWEISNKYGMSSPFRALACSCLLWSGLHCSAAVIVTENVSPGATSWPGSPILNTVANPSTASVGEGFNGGGGNTNLGQTFTITTSNYLLQTIEIYVGGGTGTGSGTNIVLNLYDLGTQTAPNPSAYNGSIIGANVFGSGAGLSVSYANQSAGVLKFDFTGVDQVILTNGHMYAFELTGVNGTTPFF